MILSSKRLMTLPRFSAASEIGLVPELKWSLVVLVPRKMVVILGKLVIWELSVLNVTNLAMRAVPRQQQLTTAQNMKVETFVTEPVS